MSGGIGPTRNKLKVKSKKEKDRIILSFSFLDFTFYLIY